MKKNSSKQSNDQLVEILVCELSNSRIKIESKANSTAKIEYIVQTSELIIEDCGHILKHFPGQLRVYDSKYWAVLGETSLNLFLRKASLNYRVPTSRAKYHAFLKELLEQIVSTGIVDANKSQCGTQINLKNGVLDFSNTTPTLLFHNPDFLLTHYLDYPYDPEAKAPRFEKFLKETLPDKETRMLVLESIASAFIPTSVLKLEKAFFFYGNGGNGKSVIFDIVSAMFGNENIGYYSLTDLTDPKGNHRVQVQGKLLNFSSDSGGKMNPGIFKQLVSKEPTSGELKYKNPVVVSDHPQIIINTNVIPNLSEGTDGLLRRVIIIPFKNNLPREKQDLNLAEKIIAQELPGVLNLIIEALKRLLKNKDFTRSSEAEALLQEVKSEANSTRSFIDDCSVMKTQNHNQKGKELYDNYRAYCYHNGFTGIKTVKKFNRSMEECGFSKMKKQDGIYFDAKGEFLNSASFTSLPS
jgi:putative DNA primase/helicase